MISKRLPLPGIFLCIFSICCPIHAAIVTTSEVQGAQISSGNSHTVNNVSLNGGNALAVVVTSENYGLFSASYNGEALTAFEGSEGIQGAAVLYLINPMASVGDLVLTGVDGGDGGGATDFSFSYFTLSQVAGLAQNSPSTASSTASGNSTLSLSSAYTTSTDGGYVVGAVINNDFRTGSATAPDYVSGNGVNGFNQINGNNSSRHFHGAVATAGTYNESFTDLEQRNVITAVAFEALAIPEPSSLLLLGLGGLGAMLLRRKRS